MVSVYGNGEPGMRDGEGRDAQFNSPQGLAWHDGVLYVADTENHAIRKVRVGKATNSYTQAPAHPLHPFGTLSIEPLYPYFLIMECQLGIAVTWSVVSVLPPVPLVGNIATILAVYLTTCWGCSWESLWPERRCEWC